MKFTVVPFHVLSHRGRSNADAWFIVDDEIGGHDNYLWKDGTINDNTGYIEYDHAHLWEAPGFWETEEEAVMFLKSYKQRNVRRKALLEALKNAYLLGRYCDGKEGRDLEDAATAAANDQINKYGPKILDE